MTSRSRTDETYWALLNAAFDLLAESGHGAFSVRQVAEAVGAHGSAVVHRFGGRDGLVRSVHQVVLEREGAALSAFQSRFRPLPPNLLACALREWLEHRARWGRRQAMVLAELQLLTFHMPSASDFGQRLERLYADFICALCPDLPAQGAVRLGRLLMPEGATWLALTDETWFRLTSEAALRACICAELGEPFERSWRHGEVAMAGPVDWSPPRAANRSKINLAAAASLLELGASRVTHRDVASRAKVALSNVLHHVGPQAQLVVSGLETCAQLYVQSLAEFARADGPLQIAPLELAVGALRHPVLLPWAALLRTGQARLPDPLGDVNLLIELGGALVKAGAMADSIEFGAHQA